MDKQNKEEVNEEVNFDVSSFIENCSVISINPAVLLKFEAFNTTDEGVFLQFYNESPVFNSKNLYGPMSIKNPLIIPPDSTRPFKGLSFYIPPQEEVILPDINEKFNNSMCWCSSSDEKYKTITKPSLFVKVNYQTLKCE